MFGKMFEVLVFLVFGLYESNAADSSGNAFDAGLVPVTKFNNKSYYLSNFYQGNFLEVIEYCDLINMDLLSIESKEENDFITQLLRKNKKSDYYWLSGAKTLNGKDWVWMTTGEPIVYTNWRQGQPDAYPNERCLEIWWDNTPGAVWNNRPCDQDRYFICEERPKNKQNVKSQNWAALFADTSHFLNINLLNYNNKSYYIGNQQALTYLDAQKYCQLIDMELITITSDDENTRIYNYIRDTMAGDKFWSGGTRSIDGNNWVWLPSARKIEYFHWQDKQPNDDNSKCLQLVQSRDTGLFWDDVLCTTTSNFICQAPTSKFRQCAEQQNSGGTGNCPVQPVTPVTPQPTKEPQVKYLAFKELATFDEAIKGCQNHSMQLVSIQNKQKNDAINKYLTENNINDALWSSGNRRSEKDPWVWLNGEKAEYFNWNDGEPNNAKKNEFCIHVFRAGADTKWNDETCTVKYGYICESLESNNGQCSSPVINVYVNNNLIGCDGTTTSSKRITDSSAGKDGRNVEVTNNVYETGSSSNSVTTKAPVKTREHKKYHAKHHNKE